MKRRSIRNIAQISMVLILATLAYHKEPLIEPETVTLPEAFKESKRKGRP